jgi:uncharacterized repeat protein (TIGR02543 family)
MTKSGCVFTGWYKEAAFTNQWDFATDTVTADIGLYAKREDTPGNLMTRPPAVNHRRIENIPMY